MTDLLKDTLTERATTADPPDLDLDAIITTGRRRIRRRRARAVLGTAFVALAVVASGLTVTQSMNDRPVPAQQPAFAERRPTYAIGDKIHYGADVIAVAPYRVNAFVQTDAGFVFLDDKNEIYVADNTGVRRIAPGKSTWRLTADDRGSLVGWVETSNDHAESVVYDVAANRELARTPIGNRFPPTASLVMGPRIAAIDGDIAYLGTVKGLYRWDLKTGATELIAQALPNAVRGVSSGQYLYQRPLQHPASGTGLAVGPTPSDSGGRPIPGRQGYLSPTAEYVVAGPTENHNAEPSAGVLSLYSVRTGAKLALRSPHSRTIFNQWLDATTFTMVGVQRSGNAPVDLLTCSATTLSCQVSAAAFSTYTFDQIPPRTTPFAVPLGTPITQYFS